MLWLSRTPGETIMINDNIKIYYQGLDRSSESTIILGFEAPKDTEIWRLEIYEARKNHFKNFEEGNFNR